MGEGRGSAIVFAVTVIVGMVVAEATTYTVGDVHGWTFNTDTWPNGKRFRAGDILGRRLGRCVEATMTMLKKKSVLTSAAINCILCKNKSDAPSFTRYFCFEKGGALQMVSEPNLSQYGVIRGMVYGSRTNQVETSGPIVAGIEQGVVAGARHGQVFKYGPTDHNVVAVDKGGYESCSTPAGAKVYKSGADQIKLKRGQNFFICSYAGHCESGMKIAITAS